MGDGLIQKNGTALGCRSIFGKWRGAAHEASKVKTIPKTRIDCIFCLTIFPPYRMRITFLNTPSNDVSSIDIIILSGHSVNVPKANISRWIDKTIKIENNETECCGMPSA